jgi:putative tryptophan/tyrosine transport system substrate-binding protein
MLALGLISSLSRPGGNITGLSLFAAEHTAKRLELIKEAVPLSLPKTLSIDSHSPTNQNMIAEC